MNENPNEQIQPFDSSEPARKWVRSKWFTRKIYEARAEKRRDFWIGVVLFFVLNVVLVLCQWGARFGLFALQPDVFSSPSVSSSLYSILSILLTVLPWVVNIGLILFFAFTRSQIALGMLAGFGIALAIAICLGVIFTIWCFYALSSGGF